MMISERYQEQISDILSCYDRMISQGTLPGWCYDQGMTVFLYARQIKIFDYPRVAQTLREKVRENAERIAKENRIEIEFIRKVNGFRKEKRIKEIIKVRGEQSGLVHIFSQHWVGPNAINLIFYCLISMCCSHSGKSQNPIFLAFLKPQMEFPPI